MELEGLDVCSVCFQWPRMIENRFHRQIVDVLVGILFTLIYCRNLRLRHHPFAEYLGGASPFLLSNSIEGPSSRTGINFQIRQGSGLMQMFSHSLTCAIPVVFSGRPHTKNVRRH